MNTRGITLQRGHNNERELSAVLVKYAVGQSMSLEVLGCPLIQRQKKQVDEELFQTEASPQITVLKLKKFEKELL